MVRAAIPTPAQQPPLTPATDFGRVVLAHQRYRLANGELIPGCSTIAKLYGDSGGLTTWANRLGLQGIDSNKYRDESAKVGSLAHYLIQSHLLELEPDVDVLRDFTPAQLQRAQYSLTTFQRWLRRHPFKAVLIEKELISEEHRFGGTIDSYGWLEGLPTLIDYKTSSRIYPGHMIQVSGYWRLLRDNGYDVRAVRVWRIAREEGAEMEERIMSGSEVMRCWRIFERLREIYDLSKGLKP